MSLQNDDVQNAFSCDPGRIVQVRITGFCSTSDFVGFVTVDQPKHAQLKIAGKLHIDQTMRTKNFRVRNDVVERGSVTKSQKGQKAYVERKNGRVFSVESTWTMFQRRLM